MTTRLNKELKRQISVDGLDYTIAIDTDSLRLIGKGKRKPDVELRWHDLLSGEAAMAVALNASLKQRQPSMRSATNLVSKQAKNGRRR